MRHITQHFDYKLIFNVDVINSRASPLTNLHLFFAQKMCWKTRIWILDGEWIILQLFFDRNFWLKLNAPRKVLISAIILTLKNLFLRFLIYVLVIHFDCKTPHSPLISCVIWAKPPVLERWPPAIKSDKTELITAAMLVDINLLYLQK